MQKSEKYSRMVTFYHNIAENSDLYSDNHFKIIDEFLRIESKYGINVTYCISDKLFKNEPALINKIYEAGHEISLSYNSNTKILNHRIILNGKETNKEISLVPFGYYSNKSKLNNELLETFWQNGFLWNAEADEAAEPYFIYKGLVRLPIAHDGGENKNWIEEFSFFLESRKYFGFNLNDPGSDGQKYLVTYENLIKTALEKNVFIITFSQAADLFRRMNLANYYSLASEGWNKRTRILYRTKRFQELIKNEVLKLKSPVIVDLGSGGGVLSTFLKDFAEKIYCVDNSPGMINDVQPDLSVKSIIGEVTDISLPDNTADFIICARVIEYLYYPELVANEIKRIGKLGAKFFITFPSYEYCKPTNQGSVPDKIRKHFSREDILAWAGQIGSGELVGVQYDEAEPKNIDDEKRYKEIEENPPASKSPTNWVFIGTIENKTLSHTNFNPILSNTFTFDFKE